MLCKLITSRREGKKQIIHTDMYGDLSRYDLSVILGIRYTEFDRMLSEGKSIEEIIESKASKNNTGKASNRNARVRLENGQYLNEYCIEHKLNYACIYRLMKVYGKTLEEAEASYNKNGQAIPKTWIFEKYGLLLKHLMLKESIDVYKVVDHMRKNYLPMEQAVEKYIVRKNSKNAKIDPDWTEELYEVLTETTDKEEYNDYLQAFYVDEDEVNCINQSKEQADNFKRKLILFDIAESLENGWFPPEEEKDLFETYDVTEDEVDIIFKELYKRFNSYGVLMGKNQEEVLTPGQIEERDEKISKYKQIVRDIHEDKTIVSMMRFMVKYNVDTNEVYRDEIQGELRKEKDACQIDQ